MDPVSTLRALDRPVTAQEAAEIIAMPGRPTPSIARTEALLRELGFRPTYSVERQLYASKERLMKRWLPPRRLAGYAFGPIDPKPAARARSIVLGALLSCVLMLGSAMLAGLIG